MVLDSSALLVILFKEPERDLLRRRRAGLNLGDCCAYALSRHAGEPLLFKGDDLARTDIARVL